MGRVMIILSLAMLSVGSNVFGAPRGELVVSEGAENTTIEPHRCYNGPELNFAQTVCDKLLHRDHKGKLVYQLATSSKQIDDVTLELKLRKGVLFQNGDPFTAEDVKFSVERYIDPKTKANFAFHYKGIKEVKIMDDYTVRIITREPDPLMINRLALALYIVPKKYITSKGDDYFSENPLGTGAFKFVKWLRGDRIIVEANEKYWDGPPGVERIIFKPIPEDATRIAELISGNSHIISNVPPFLVSQVKANRGLNIQSIPSGRIMYCYLNTVAEGPLKDKRVRQALNYAIDKTSIVNQVLKGYGHVMGGVLVPYQFGYDETLRPYPYDPDRAKKLLAEAGYAKGLKLNVNTSSGRYLLDKEVSQAIAGMLNRIGIETDFRVQEWGNYVRILTGKELKDIGFIGWKNSIFDAEGTFPPLISKDMEACKKDQFSYYINGEVVGMLDLARRLHDSERRKEIYRKVQRIIYDEAPFIFLYQQVDNYGVSSKVRGFEAKSDEFIDLNKVTVD